jgi:hypothetical protein
MTTPAEPPIPRWLEHGFVWSALGLLALHGARAAAALDGRATWLAAVAALAAGYALADLASGVIHWAFDRLGSRNTPLIGETVIQSFRYHHVDPADMMRGDFVNTNGKNSAAILPPLIAGLWLSDPVALTGLTGFGLGVALTNQIHKWAHVDDPGPLVRRLQRWRLILHPAHHDHHHRRPHDRNYCITTGWCNPVCDHLRLFPWGERQLRRLGVTIFDG